ncbi:MAG: PEGA domain-containing protein, partial [Myxococcota bacterium]
SRSPSPSAAASPAAAAKLVAVVIESPNLYGEVVVNGKSYGFTPVKATLPVGPATVELRVGKVVRKTQTITVDPAGTRVVLR